MSGDVQKIRPDDFSVSPSGEVSPAKGHKTNSPAESTISESDKVALAMIANAPFPQLQHYSPVNDGAIIAGIDAAASDAKNKATLLVLKNWADDIEKERERIKEEIARIRRKREETNGQGIPGPIPQEFIARLERSEDLLTRLSKGVDLYVNRVESKVVNASNELPLVSAAVAVGTALPGVAVPGITQARETSPGVFEVLFANPDKSLPLDLKYLSEMIMSLFSQASQFRTAAETIPGAKADAKAKEIDIEAARNNARKVIGYVQNPEFDQFILAMLVDTMEGGQLMSDAQKQEYLNKIKTYLLVHALAMVYKAEHGGITEKELQDLASGQLPLGDIQKTLMQFINKHVAEIPDSDAKKSWKQGIFDALGKLSSIVPLNLFRDFYNMIHNSLWPQQRI